MRVGVLLWEILDRTHPARLAKISPVGVLVLSKNLAKCAVRQVFWRTCLMVFLAFTLKLPIQALVSLVPTHSVFWCTIQFQQNEHTPWQGNVETSFVISVKFINWNVDQIKKIAHFLLHKSLGTRTSWPKLQPSSDNRSYWDMKITIVLTKKKERWQWRKRRETGIRNLRCKKIHCQETNTYWIHLT